MTNFITVCFWICLIFASSIESISAQVVHHKIKVTFTPGNREIYVVDTLEVNNNFGARNNSFWLNSNFKIDSETGTGNYKKPVAIKDDGEYSGRRKYYISLASDQKLPKQIILSYRGSLVKGAGSESLSKYTIGDSTDSLKIFLSNASCWFPVFESSLFTYDMCIEHDSTLNVLCVGKKSRNDRHSDSRKQTFYRCEFPIEDAYIVAGRFTVYHKTIDGIDFNAYLLSKDDGIAEKYLTAASGYIKLYESIIGKYPFSSFSLVESTDEVGLGMPSFTIMGSKILRYPFIINSSFPHEILHNYFGNSVYTNYSDGNWNEGLTTYLADHLFSEQSGNADEYRKSALQKFTDFVRPENDYPVSFFTSKKNPVDEAIGYNKSMMIFEMLRREAGDSLFKESIAYFYRENKFKLASFSDIRKAFEKICNSDFSAFFEQWLKRKGAPEISIGNISAKQVGAIWHLEFTLKQNQKEDPYKLKVPVYISLKNSDIVKAIDVELSDRSEVFKISLDDEPVKIDVDPAYNIFRKIDKSEHSQTLTRVYGAKDAIIVLPSAGSFVNEYAAFAQGIKNTYSSSRRVASIVYDNEIDKLPANNCWVIGVENKFANISENLKQFDESTHDFAVQLKEGLQNSAVVYTFSNKNDSGFCNVFVSSPNKESLELLRKKIFYYGKYSYLLFSQASLENTMKGIFPVVNSSLSRWINVSFKDKVKAKRKERKALVIK